MMTLIFRRIIGIAFITGLLLQCNTTEKHTLCRLTSKLETLGASEIATSYTYQDSRLTKETRVEGGITYETAYHYDFNGNVDESTFTTGGVSVKTSYSYNGLNQLIYTLYTYNGDTTYTYYGYNDFSQLISKSVSSQSSGGPVLLSSESYEYADVLTRNPSKITTEAGSNTVVINYLYDNKFNPDRDLVLPSLQHYNNITQIIQGSAVETITYMYNSAGYPVSAVSSSGKTTVWTYDCQDI